MGEIAAREDGRAQPAGAARDLSRASLLLTFVATGGMILLAFQRGPWLDEFWTLWLTDPSLPLSRAYADNWSNDVHPPLYYAIVWAARLFLGDELSLLRFVNALPLLIVLPTMLLWRRRQSQDRWGSVYVGLLVGCPYLIAYFAELRSYFAIITLSGALVAQLRMVRWSAHDLARGDGGLSVLIACTIVVALNLHFFSSPILCALIAVEGLQLLLRRRWRAVALLSASLIVGLAIMAATLAVFITKIEPFFSYPATPFECLKIVLAGIAIGAVLNPGVDLAAALWLTRHGWRGSRGLAWGVAGLGAAASLLLVQSIVSGSLTMRYTFVLMPMAAAVAADLAVDALAASRLLVGLFLVGGLAVQAVGITHEARSKRWLTLAPQLRALSRACPSSRIVGVDNNAVVPPSERAHVAGWIGAFDLGYHWVAKREGFAVTTTREDRDTAVATGNCPLLLWSEHDFGAVPEPRELARRARLRLPPGAFDSLEIGNDGHRRLIVLRPRSDPGRGAE
jgi:hypothetical protein